jgi:hypothetical protein
MLFILLNMLSTLNRLVGKGAEFAAKLHEKVVIGGKSVHPSVIQVPAGLEHIETHAALPYRIVVDSAINATEPQTFAEQIGGRLRHAAGDLASMRRYDAALTAKYCKTRAVLTAQLYDQEGLLIERGTVQYIDLVLRMKSILRSEVDSRKGGRIRALATKIWGQTFALFPSARDALDATIGAMQAWDVAGSDRLFAFLPIEMQH